MRGAVRAGEIPPGIGASEDCGRFVAMDATTRALPSVVPIHQERTACLTQQGPEPTWLRALLRQFSQYPWNAQRRL